MEAVKSLPVLDAAELRVLGSLMEKARTTPEYYPMSLNALTAACNQKTSRNPVVSYDENTVALALDSLKKRGLISTATGGSSRTIKYKHNFAIVYPVVPAEVSIICLLILRGPQTPGEINTNAGRLYEFESIDEVQQMLEKLAADEPPYLVQLPRRPGQKEARYAHLLAGEPANYDDNEPEIAGRPGNQLETRISALEQEVTDIKAALQKLMIELGVQ